MLSKCQVFPETTNRSFRMICTGRSSGLMLWLRNRVQEVEDRRKGKKNWCKRDFEIIILLLVRSSLPWWRKVFLMAHWFWRMEWVVVVVWWVWLWAGELLREYWLSPGEGLAGELEGKNCTLNIAEWTEIAQYSLTGLEKHWALIHTNTQKIIIFLLLTHKVFRERFDPPCLYLEGHCSELHSSQAGERLYWLLLEITCRVMLTLWLDFALVLPVLFSWLQHKAYRPLVFLGGLKLSEREESCVRNWSQKVQFTAQF